MIRRRKRSRWRRKFQNNFVVFSWNTETATKGDEVCETMDKVEG